MFLYQNVMSCLATRWSYTQHDDVHQVVHAGPLENRLPAVLHQFGVGTCRDSSDITSVRPSGTIS